MASKPEYDRFRALVRWLRHEPLVLFMALGLGLFLIDALVSSSGDDTESRRIRVDRDALAEYMQGRARSSEDGAVDPLETMQADDLKRLVDAYVRDEAMYREAMALGLERKDQLIRLRLVQSLQFMFRNLGEAGQPPEAELRKFYERRQARYATPATITFSHIFFDEATRGRSGAEQAARQTKARLNAQRGAPDPAKGWPGDRFAYNLAYADRDEAMVASHFGPEMARQLFAAKADEATWQGPFHSPSGYHLVRIDRLETGKAIPFDQAKVAVERDYLGWRGDEAEKAAVDALIGEFDVSISGDVRKMIEDGARGK